MTLKNTIRKFKLNLKIESHRTPNEKHLIINIGQALTQKGIYKTSFINFNEFPSHHSAKGYFCSFQRDSTTTAESNIKLFLKHHKRRMVGDLVRFRKALNVKRREEFQIKNLRVLEGGESKAKKALITLL